MNESRVEGSGRRTLRWVVFVGVANFLVFVGGAMYLGGYAISGNVWGGHYFVAEHGHLTEVSRGAFLYSEWHAWSVLVMHPIVLVCAWLASRGAQEPK
jgi:hypothetical protein